MMWIFTTKFNKKYIVIKFQKKINLEVRTILFINFRNIQISL